MRRIRATVCLAATVFGAVAFGPTINLRGDEPPVPRFNRDVLPVLSDLCFRCHGPDEAERSSGLRLDTRDGLFSRGEGGPIIVPGDSGASELWRRISTDDADLRMPPPDFERTLTDAQRLMIRRWIEAGAEWQPHWAFVAPERSAVPSSIHNELAENPIDQFINARLVEAQWKPARLADKSVRLRRVTLDLTGLPPTLDELDAFVADDSPDAYERAVDRLLASPVYGERMAAPWLDAARYADTSGYQNDGPRDMWRWRDWVIEALNAGMPFDRFTVEQLAGDLLPNATLEQQIATGFNRNHRGNAEGGIIPDEYAVEYVVDRVTTTGAVWLGLSLECARCHDHKYDAISQREFYQLYAFFNNIPEHGRAIKEGNSPPYILAPTREQREQLAIYDADLAAAESQVARLTERSRREQQVWETSQRERLDAEPTLKSSSNDDALAGDWTIDDGLIVRREFGSTEPEVGFDDTLSLDGAATEVVGDIARFTYFDKFSCAAWIRPEEPSGTIISRMTPVEEGDGYSLHLQDGRLQANLVKRWLDDSIRVETRRQLAPAQWHHVVLTYDGSRRADGVSIYVDGEREPCDVRLDALNQSFDNDQPLRIGGGAANFVGQIDDARVYNRCLPADEVRVIACADSIERLVQTAASDRDARQTAKLRAYYIANAAAKDVRAAHERYAQLDHRRAKFVESLPTVMVMQELPKPSEAHVLIRGLYDRPGESVGRGVPACLPPLTEIPVDSVGKREQSPPDRLTLARWLVDATHPLTARVIVNRYWQMFFGVGLVKTSEDFGVQGEPPSHPELLDWLAVEFTESGWDVKRLHRLIVTSAAYQRDSQTTPELLRVDPENRLLARGPRFRLSAEMIRDQALALAGLLNSQVGGPSVKPYQPEGLWKEIATVTDYNQSHGRDLYRRSLYTYWKRTVASPTMLTFDATARETCTVRRSRTNTPLQALNLLNDVAFVEAAKQMAWRVQSALPADRRDDAKERMRTAFRMATARWPSATETDALVRGHDRHTRYFQQHIEEARELLASGESLLPDEAIAEEQAIARLAADTMMMNLLLNLDETLTKE